MTAQPQWGNIYIQEIKALITAIEDARLQWDILSTDSTLPTKYLASNNTRPDLTAQDFVNANSALQQLLFTFDSGSPAQKAYLYKMV